MSGVSPEVVDARRYGGVNGNDITLTEKRTWSNNKVIEFNLRNDSLHRIQLNLLFFCLALFVGNLTNSLIIVTLSAIALALHCKRITTSIDFDTLLVVESVGIQITSKKIFSGFNSSQFLPWTTVEDVFINEVITGGIEAVQGMPGIYVPGIGEPDKPRTTQTQPTLNVPGSYWLSHKQNIYKFTFQYREPIRDDKEFSYNDELLRVIKRIIKCHPSQGQLQTLHLSITYKHTFWTRQDKMFAMLKFRNRQNAAVFPQAFILTISIVDEPKTEIENTVIKNEPNLDSKDSISIQALQIPPDSPSIGTLNGNVPQPIENVQKFTRSFTRSNSRDNITDSIPLAEDIVDRQKMDLELSSNGANQLENRETKWTRNSRKRRRETWTNSSKSNSMDIYENELELGNDTEDDQQGFFNNTDKSPRKREIPESGIDAEPIAARSSDITDQVMEGLMFTIKQVEDNVKVEEQRTKMELDEVLENSEKVETKEGERSLVNSSLLRLENLITKIEVPPEKQIKYQKTPEIVPLIDNLASLSRSPVTERTNIPFSTRERNEISSQFITPIPIELAHESPNKIEKNFTKESSTPKIDRNYVNRKICDNITAEISDRAVSDDNDNNNNNNNNNNNINIENDNAKTFGNGEVRIDMWKLLQDITRGVKVVVERISDLEIKNATGSSSSTQNSVASTRTITNRRILTRSKK